MKRIIIFTFIFTSCALFADSIDDRVNELEKRVAKLEQVLKTALDKQELQQRINSLREKAKNRIREDAKYYSQDELQSIESLYQSASQNINTQESIENLKTLISKYPKANRSGCAVLYIGQMSKDEEQIKYLQQAINEFGDCFYLNGVQVGAYARFVLSRVYLLKGEKEKSSKLVEEIKVGYPDAVNHKGISLLSIIDREPEPTN